MEVEELLCVRLVDLASWYANAVDSATEWEKSLASWRLHGQDPGADEARCRRARDAELSRAGKYLLTIREKLRRVDLLGGQHYASLIPDYYRLVPEPLLYGVPDSERVYEPLAVGPGQEGVW